MSRELKFRAWDKESCEMEYAKERSGMSDVFFDFTGDKFKLMNHIESDYPREIDSVIMQFTGLKDKNGIEIYEGDIVNFMANYSSNPCGYFNGAIVWNYDSWKLVVGKYEYSISEETDEFDCKTEIIGNIYENPELLKP